MGWQNHQKIDMVYKLLGNICFHVLLEDYRIVYHYGPLDFIHDNHLHILRYNIGRIRSINTIESWVICNSCILLKVSMHDICCDISCTIETILYLSIACGFSWDHPGHWLSQWETTLQCNVISHWLNPYTEWYMPVESPGTLFYSLSQMTLINID